MRGLKTLVHLVRSTPPHLLAVKVARRGARLILARLESAWARRQCSYTSYEGKVVWHLTQPVIPEDVFKAQQLQALYADRKMDLLGSGWVSVQSLSNDSDKECWSADKARVRGLLALIDDPQYRFIDWHRDVKSGYRWNRRVRGPACPYGHLPGVDIKMPWEMARCRHLLYQAQFYALTQDAVVAHDIRNQILDFAAANPPGWGVNWVCAMDVAIRIATHLVAIDMLRAAGWKPDIAFEQFLADHAADHGRFIANHLEGGPYRGNHYLADLCGLVFVGLYLTPTDESQRWLKVGWSQLEAEIERQFLPDGGNFEASVPYHRLSAELALFTVALGVGAGLQMGATALSRLKGAGVFARAVTMPSGRVVQIGDNDSGRFLSCGFDLDSGDPPHFRHLDFSCLIAAIDRAFGKAEHTGSDAQLVAGLLQGQTLHAAFMPLAVTTGQAPAAEAYRVDRVIIPLPFDGVTSQAFPDFGLYIWRGDRFFISLRAGPIGQAGNGGHAHNDQLSVEIEVDGIAWTQDPGTYLYTPDLAARDRYRSVQAHCAPRMGDQEPARLLLPFRLEDRAKAYLTAFDDDHMAACHTGFGVPVIRHLWRQNGILIIEDRWGGDAVGPSTEVREHRFDNADQLRRHWPVSVAFSPGYGLVDGD